MEQNRAVGSIGINGESFDGDSFASQSRFDAYAAVERNFRPVSVLNTFPKIYEKV